MNTNNQGYPHRRLRRMRMDDFSRRLLRTIRLSVDDLIYPMFVMEGKNKCEAIPSMPGIMRHSPDRLVQEAEAAYELGIPAVALFPVIASDKKSAGAEEAIADDGLIPRVCVQLKKALPQLGIITDVALDPYTSHGQDGLLNQRGQVDNDSTVELLVKQALSQAAAGTDVVAPSAMMDGCVGAIRAALEKAGFVDTRILSYSAKYASHFYGPFRDAVGSQAALGSSGKETYQMDPANKREALAEVQLDISEGADMVMVKPGLPYLDVLAYIHDNCQLPVLAYQVSGEYAMLKSAAAQGWLDEKSCVMETMLAFKRAGAAAVLSYYARNIAEWLQQNSQ